MQQQIIDNFPQLNIESNGKPLVYLDSAATTLKAKNVIQRLQNFYLYENANVHRGAHMLSDRATASYEQAREDIKDFINASSANEVIFTKGTTESINLLAFSLKSKLGEGDKVLITEMEHHSNIVAWQLLVQKCPGVQLEYVKLSEDGELDLEDLDNKLDENTKIVSFTACSNALGTINPVKEICEKVRKTGAISIVDAAQWVAARPTDVQDLGCDFLVFSGHKIFAPFGIGVLYGKEYLMNSLPPYQGGGSMIDSVEYSQSTFLDSPQRFEAGTPNIAGAIALGEAVNYVKSIGFSYIENQEQKLVEACLDGIKAIPGCSVFGKPKHRSNIISFALEGAHHSDIGTLLDKQGIAVRAGHHCCQILMKAIGVGGTARVAFSIYNQEKDVEALIKGLKKVKELV